MADEYDTPRDWFFKVAGSTTQVYSSAVGDYVPVGDPTYAAWSQKGNKPKDIDTEINLGNVLAPYFLRPAASAAGVLDAYKEALADRLTPIDVNSKLFFNLENRMRVLEGRPELTFVQYRAIIKALM